MPCGYCSDTSRRVLFMFLKICGELALVGAIASVFIVAARGLAEERAAEEAAGRDYMLKLDEWDAKGKNQLALASWQNQINVTAANDEKYLQISLDVAEEQREYWKETMTYLWHEFEDETLKRKYRKYSMLGTSALPADLNERLIQAINNMRNIYAKATICDYHDELRCDLHIEPEVTDIFARSDDPDELKHAWVQWHRAAGIPSKNHFIEYIALDNEAAKLNGYDNAAEWWLSYYESSDIENQFIKLWEQVKPLYEELHAYVRFKLRKKYGNHVVSEKGPIPAHLLGNVWAQTWGAVEKFSRPFPNKPEFDLTEALIRQNYTALKVFEKADDFFKSISLSGVPDSFWKNSVIERPDDGRDMVCHASAWDFFDGEDFRVRQCTTISADSYRKTFHEMGHIQYYMQYDNMPTIFKEGANPGFHEAVGDVIALSSTTPKHLRNMGLLEDGPEDLESNINHLYEMSLEKIAFLPYGFLVDIYRHGIFRGITDSYNYNCNFWQLRESLQGIEPPVTRTEEDFDAAAKYHVSADVEYMRYYVSTIIQFQLHRALCEKAGEYERGNPEKLLSNCNIYNSTVAGNALGDMLRLGSSKPWPDAMEVVTSQRIMDASAILEYFEPLHQWLKEENKRNEVYVGWEPSYVEYCTPDQRGSMELSGFKDNLRRYSFKH